MGFELEKIANAVGGEGTGFELERIANGVESGGGSGSGSDGSVPGLLITYDSEQKKYVADKDCDEAMALFEAGKLIYAVVFKEPAYDGSIQNYYYVLSEINDEWTYKKDGPTTYDFDTPYYRHTTLKFVRRYFGNRNGNTLPEYITTMSVMYVTDYVDGEYNPYDVPQKRYEISILDSASNRITINHTVS